MIVQQVVETIFGKEQKDVMEVIWAVQVVLV
jgi:hypothetical protein